MDIMIMESQIVLPVMFLVKLVIVVERISALRAQPLLLIEFKLWLLIQVAVIALINSTV